MPTLYVTEPGSRLEKDYQRLTVVNREDEVILSVPVARVEEVALIGSVGVTTPALKQMLLKDIGFSILTVTGRLLGRLQSPFAKNVFLRRLQYQRAADPDFCCGIARDIVLGKLKNQRAMACRMRRQRSEVDPAVVVSLAKLLRRIPACHSLSQLRGVEGQAARLYFKIFRAALIAGWDSQKRSRRPPRDPLNALLSLGYSLLTQNLMTAIEIAGLDPYEGFFHADQYSRPALALDLMEEFRSIIVDSVVMNLINRRVLVTDDFLVQAEDGCRLTDKGLRKFLMAYTARVQTAVIHPFAGRKISYQKCFEVQARIMRRAIEKDEPYRPFQTR